MVQVHCCSVPIFSSHARMVAGTEPLLALADSGRDWGIRTDDPMIGPLPVIHASFKHPSEPQTMPGSRSWEYRKLIGHEDIPRSSYVQLEIPILGHCHDLGGPRWDASVLVNAEPLISACEYCVLLNCAFSFKTVVSWVCFELHCLKVLDLLVRPDDQMNSLFAYCWRSKYPFMKSIT